MCNGSGYVVPYPYRKRVKCNHRWSKRSFDDSYDAALQKKNDADAEFKKWCDARENLK